MQRSHTRWHRAAAIAISGLVGLACTQAESAEPLRTDTIRARDIIISARAAGVVSPVTTVEVKSQASGEITEVHVTEGQAVRRGDLLVRVDPRIPENAVTQAQADSAVSQASLQNAESRLRRAEQLFAEQALTEEEVEVARLARATAQADLIRAVRALEDARIAYVQTEVRAPSHGVVLSLTVAEGSVIASASRDVGGGAVLLRMASLDTVEVRALVDERDIGRIKAGLAVTVTTASFPDRPFRGEVLRVGAEAIVNQNVTTFPVIVRIPNPQGLLKPGMNAEVEVMIGEERDAVAVPNTALRDPRELDAAADFLGISRDSLKAELRNVPPGAFVVFTMDGGRIRAVPVTTGLTDYDYSAVREGLSPGDTVLILPTAGLLQDQARRQEWAQRRAGGGPFGGN
ncbi:MAG TPA: efflux RND transporter periplasmic adaptor subunit [Gemmatimonadaceae bacterium]|nr:efflux RND transporter periplasmic adaptor subunit [Gemmatimonadaceae bacterium]HRQ77942.1 efflux RND transporter periplasmic adaptor subunit [Gemmatimonadaceae bacterium]